MKKHDIILLAVIVIILLPIVILLLNTGKGATAVVKSDGKVIDTLNLSINGTYTYKNDNGYNIVEVSDGKVRVIEADCPNQDCVNKGYIKRNNESVICLPHKFEVTVKSKDNEYDVIQ
ncbi:MAG: NusG domain II-containing protein [Lachnospiraceae bacterium]|nr:NusG domain II-containing protein [Lachnospiraceae bacterium]MBR5066801.1 NusG domain II-containing protein [Lachnospiraceae bacterium]MBR5916897.1 NusG domain II-containing protein [Lachnospiraceae bacterium]